MKQNLKKFRNYHWINISWTISIKAQVKERGFSDLDLLSHSLNFKITFAWIKKENFVLTEQQCICIYLILTKTLWSGKNKNKFKMRC